MVVAGLGGDDEVSSLVEWVSYCDNIGYIDYERYLQLPSDITNYIIAIRVGQQLKADILALDGNKDRESRKKLSDNINKNEAFFR